MIDTKYGAITEAQLESYKVMIHKKLFWLLLYKDPKTKDQWDINFDKYFTNLMGELDGLNALLCYPSVMIRIMGLLESAGLETMKATFDFKQYRKYVLDAQALIDKIGK